MLPQRVGNWPGERKTAPADPSQPSLGLVIIHTQASLQVVQVKIRESTFDTDVGHDDIEVSSSGNACFMVLLHPSLISVTG